MNTPLYGNDYRKILSNFATLRVEAQIIPNMTVNISSGGFWLYTRDGASYIEYSGGRSPLIIAPVVGALWVIVAISETGLIVVLEGDSNNLPNIPRYRTPLATIYIESTTTQITNDMIYDVRPLFEMAIKNHGDLLGTNLAGSHPMGAITGLYEIIDTFINTETFQLNLNQKADNNGIEGSTFSLNKNQIGEPTLDASLQVNRGNQNAVSIKWNETDNLWQLTNDGITWKTININNLDWVNQALQQNIQNINSTISNLTWASNIGAYPPDLSKKWALTNINGTFSWMEIIEVGSVLVDMTNTNIYSISLPMSLELGVVDVTFNSQSVIIDEIGTFDGLDLVLRLGLIRTSTNTSINVIGTNNGLDLLLNLGEIISSQSTINNLPYTSISMEVQYESSIINVVGTGTSSNLFLGLGSSIGNNNDSSYTSINMVIQ